MVRIKETETQSEVSWLITNPRFHYRTGRLHIIQTTWKFMADSRRQKVQMITSHVENPNTRIKHVRNEQKNRIRIVVYYFCSTWSKEKKGKKSQESFELIHLINLWIISVLNQLNSAGTAIFRENKENPNRICKNIPQISVVDSV